MRNTRDDHRWQNCGRVTTDRRKLSNMAPKWQNSETANKRETDQLRSRLCQYQILCIYLFENLALSSCDQVSDSNPSRCKLSMLKPTTGSGKPIPVVVTHCGKFCKWFKWFGKTGLVKYPERRGLYDQRSADKAVVQNNSVEKVQHYTPKKHVE